MTEPTSGSGTTLGSGSPPLAPVTSGAPAPSPPTASPPKVTPGLSAMSPADIHRRVDEDAYALGLSGTEVQRTTAEKNKHQNDPANEKAKFDTAYDEARARYTLRAQQLDGDIAEEIDRQINIAGIKTAAARVVQSHIASYGRLLREKHSAERNAASTAKQEEEQAAAAISGAAEYAIADEITLRLAPAGQAKILISKVFEASASDTEKQFTDLGRKYDNVF
jgi:hypothetical protein